jgi:hypothetical protein
MAQAHLLVIANNNEIAANLAVVPNLPANNP